MLNLHPKSLLGPLAGAVLALATGPAVIGLDDTSEPAARYTLTIDGEGHAVTGDTPSEIVIDGKQHTLSIEECDTRILRAAGASFEYPRMMSFEFEKDLLSKTWTLDGNDAVLILFRFSLPPSVDEFIEEQVAAYGSLGTVKSRDTEITLDGKSIKGTLIKVEAEMFCMTVEVFPLDGAESSKRWLILQDVSDDINEASEEYAELKKLLRETLTMGD